MRALRPECLMPSHGAPVHGAAEIDETLGNYAKAIRHVHDETVKGINGAADAAADSRSRPAARGIGASAVSRGTLRNGALGGQGHLSPIHRLA